MTDINAAEAVQEHTADRRAYLRERLTNGAGKVTYVDLPICGQEHRLRFDFNAWCDVELEAAVTGPVAAYRQLVEGRASPLLVRAMILNALKCGSDDAEFKPGPLVDRLLADYPFGVAIGIAEVAVAAFLVGVDPTPET